MTGLKHTTLRFQNTMLFQPQTRVIQVPKCLTVLIFESTTSKAVFTGHLNILKA